MAQVQIIAVENKSGRSKTGNDYNMDIAQCILHGDDGKLATCELTLPKGHAPVQPGAFYNPIFTLVRDGNGKAQARVKELQLVKLTSASAPAPASKAA